jgi:ABC-type bacteriocin/lantibiotic exporter with double-glycine peptidase domain
MMSDTQTRTDTPAEPRADTRRSPFARRPTPPGPRATFSQLLPFIFEHRPVLIWVAILSVIGALASLAQPLLVSQVISIVEAGEPLGWLVWALIALVVVSGII